jgi:uncharacterized protein YhbP (UPF0306 family)
LSKRAADPQVQILHDLLSLPVLTLATIDKVSLPHATSAYFAADDQSNLYFYSDPTSQLAIDLGYTASASVSIGPIVAGGSEFQVLQMRGSARILSGSGEISSAQRLYNQKFPFASRLKNEHKQNNLYVFIPDWIRLTDHSKGSAGQDEWQIK